MLVLLEVAACAGAATAVIVIAQRLWSKKLADLPTIEGTVKHIMPAGSQQYLFVKDDADNAVILRTDAEHEFSEGDRIKAQVRERDGDVRPIVSFERTRPAQNPPAGGLSND